ncbi:Ctr copper transporter [Halenospora varia]|nr:Ctr copper transporter [Halenospora varia]
MSSMFSTGTETPLYFTTWMPMSISAYAGTCIFLIVLAVIFRVLIAFKSVLEERWIDAELNRRYVVVIRKPNTKERSSSDADSKIALLTENGVEEDVMVVRKHIKGTMPWSITIDGRERMLSIMTMNVGYFLSVLGGTFLGSLVVGRYATGAVTDQTLHA